MEDAYYRWLIDLLDDDMIRVNYQKMMSQLFHMDYFWEYEYDGNRALDGLHLRKEYGQSIGYPEFGLPQSCSVLEMMIALARRIDNEIMFEPSIGHKMLEWFWLMICNLGLDKFDDFSYDPFIIEEIMYTFMHHLYEINGVGSPFPCFGTNKKESIRARILAADFRKVDLWWHMNQYFLENFY